jgi:Domain of unknown function (DUF397)
MGAEPNPYTMLVWRKSRASGGSGECVEVAQWDSSVLIRDSHDRSGAVLIVTPSQWLGLLRRTRNGEVGWE